MELGIPFFGMSDCNCVRIYNLEGGDYETIPLPTP